MSRFSFELSEGFQSIVTDDVGNHSSTTTDVIGINDATIDW